MNDQAVAVMSRLVSLLSPTVPLVLFDLEATGPWPEFDRIVQIAMTRFDPETGAIEAKKRLVNPGMPIPPETTEVHGITDAMVASEPAFRQIAKSVDAAFAGAVLIGYNAGRFDNKMLQAELKRAGIERDVISMPVIDPQSIYQEREKRGLAECYKRYTGKDMEGAHDAMVDVVATGEALVGQLEQLEDLPRDVMALAAVCERRRPGQMDRDGKFMLRAGVPTVAFSKNIGTPLATVGDGFLRWVLDNEFAADTKAVAQGELDRRGRR